MQISRLFDRPYPVYSMEVFPPKTKSSIETVYTTLAGLKGLPVDFISVTYGAGGSEVQKNKTCEIAGLIKKEYGIEPVAHLTCVTSTREDVLEIIDFLKKEGIDNVLPLRGDINPQMERKYDFYHANELAAFVKRHYPECSMAGACYPEVHYEAENMDQDITNLMHKIDAGVDHLVTQVVFINDNCYAFLDKLRARGVDVPVEAGVMPLTSVSQVDRMVNMCGAILPQELYDIVDKYKDAPADLEKAGVDFTIRQCLELIERGVDGIHLYTMNKVKDTKTITEAVVPALGRPL